MFAIDLDKVCYVIVSARSFDAEVSTISDEDSSNAVDDDMRAALSDSDDTGRDELVKFIDDLNIDQQNELVALAWIGRGSFSTVEWQDAKAEAHAQHNGRTGEYLLGMPLLGDYLEEGLAAFGHSCSE